MFLMRTDLANAVSPLTATDKRDTDLNATGFSTRKFSLSEVTRVIWTPPASDGALENSDAGQTLGSSAAEVDASAIAKES
jgi:hypothetical protein